VSKVLGFAFGFGFLPMFGGNWNNGLNCGLWYWNLNNASSLSNVNVGGRLLIYYNLFAHHFPCPLAKISRNWIGLVAPFERKIGRQK
jgi:hypothetical protein